jgi:hypothetical protein
VIRSRRVNIIPDADEENLGHVLGYKGAARC